jgi:hypothetical protein
MINAECEVAVRQCLSFGTVVIRTLRAYIISSILPWPAKIKENNLTNQLAIATVSGGRRIHVTLPGR